MPGGVPLAMNGCAPRGDIFAKMNGAGKDQP